MNNMDNELDAILGTDDQPSNTDSNPSENIDFEKSMGAFDDGEESSEEPTGADQNQDPVSLKPGEVLIDGKPFPIDERFQDKDPLTGVARTLQSKIDKTENNYQLLNEKYTKLEQSDAFLNLLQTDPKVLKAFVHKISPDIIPQTDPTDYVKKKIKEEFGEDFEYDPEQARDPLSKHFDYLDRVRELKKEAKETTGLPESFEDIMKMRTEQAEEEKTKMIETKNKLIKEMNSNDDEYGRFSQWVSFLTQNPNHLFKMFRYAYRKQGKAPSIPGSSGGTVNTTIQTQLNDLLGARQ